MINQKHNEQVEKDNNQGVNQTLHPISQFISSQYQRTNKDLQRILNPSQSTQQLLQNQFQSRIESMEECLSSRSNFLSIFQQMLEQELKKHNQQLDIQNESEESYLVLGITSTIKYPSKEKDKQEMKEQQQQCSKELIKSQEPEELIISKDYDWKNIDKFQIQRVQKDQQPNKQQSSSPVYSYQLKCVQGLQEIVQDRYQPDHLDMNELSYPQMHISFPQIHISQSKHTNKRENQKKEENQQKNNNNIQINTLNEMKKRLRSIIQHLHQLKNQNKKLKHFVSYSFNFLKSFLIDQIFKNGLTNIVQIIQLNYEKKYQQKIKEINQEYSTNYLQLQQKLYIQQQKQKLYIQQQKQKLNIQQQNNSNYIMKVNNQEVYLNKKELSNKVNKSYPNNHTFNQQQPISFRPCTHKQNTQQSESDVVNSIFKMSKNITIPKFDKKQNNYFKNTYNNKQSLNEFDKSLCLQKQSCLQVSKIKSQISIWKSGEQFSKINFTPNNNKETPINLNNKNICLDQLNNENKGKINNLQQNSILCQRSTNSINKNEINNKKKEKEISSNNKEQVFRSYNYDKINHINKNMIIEIPQILPPLTLTNHYPKQTLQSNFKQFQYDQLNKNNKNIKEFINFECPQFSYTGYQLNHKFQYNGVLHLKKHNLKYEGDFHKHKMNGKGKLLIINILSKINQQQKSTNDKENPNKKIQNPNKYMENPNKYMDNPNRKIQADNILVQRLEYYGSFKQNKIQGLGKVFINRFYIPKINFKSTISKMLQINNNQLNCINKQGLINDGITINYKEMIGHWTNNQLICQI